MKKILATLFTCLIIGSLANAQKDQKDYSKEDEKIYNKLANLFTMDNYVKCMVECDSYIKNESTARSPYPYLYMSMCYFAVHTDQESFDMKKYKDPLRKALSYMGRFKKKDKSGELQGENADYLRDLMRGALLEAATLDGKKDLKNLQSLARDLAKNYDKDGAMVIISGVYLLRSEVKPEGDRNVEVGMNILKKKQSEGDAKFDFDQSDLLAQAFILYTDYLMETKDQAKAKTTIQFAKDLVPDNEKISKQADKVGK